MTSMSMNRTRDSPFRESEWDRRLDDMLEDLGGGQGPAQGVLARPGGGQVMPGGGQVVSGQQYSSSSMQQSYSYSSSSSSQQQNQVRMQTSSSAQQQTRVTNGGRSATNNYSMNKSASASSMKNNADDVLKDLETGLKKSTNYIEELQGRYQGPEGGQEWREVRRGGDPGGTGDYSLEQEVQHMIGGIDGTESQQHQSALQQQQQQHYGSVNQHNLTTYKVQSNQYGASGERLLSPGSGANGMFDEDADRPASRLKQNIDDLDTLLYDLNNARTLSPDPGPDYGNTGLGPGQQGLDSDDYDETVGHQGHVKRTVQAFNEFSTSSQVTEMAGAEAVSSGKPPSPSPRRKTGPSPVTSRKTPTTPQQQQRPQQTAYSQQHQQSYNTSYSSSSQMMEADTRQESSGPAMSQLAHDPEPPHQPSYYTKYSSAAPSSPLPTSVAFPNHQPRSGTPQSPPKRVEELMSEFQEFDTSHGSVSPTPAMFSRPRQAEVAEHLDGPPRQIKLEPQPKLSPPPAPASVNQKGPEVYYPPGAEFTKSVQASHPVGDGGSMSLHEKGRGERRARDRGHDRGAEGGDKQGAAVIPICLPLCCAAPCVIM